MTKEEKQLLLIDLCARLPYEVKCLVNFDDGTEDIMTLKTGLPNCFGRWDFRNKDYSGCSNSFKPYLRPMSSMTVEEGERLEQIAKETLGDFMFEAEEDGGAIYHMDKWKTLSPAMFDYLNSIHIDYRGLIGRGLALPAPEGMYDKCETSNI